MLSEPRHTNKQRNTSEELSWRGDAGKRGPGHKCASQKANAPPEQ